MAQALGLRFGRRNRLPHRPNQTTKLELLSQQMQNDGPAMWCAAVLKNVDSLLGQDAIFLGHQWSFDYIIHCLLPFPAALDDLLHGSLGDYRVVILEHIRGEPASVG